MLSTEVDEDLASLISFTKSKISHYLICRSIIHNALEVIHHYGIHLNSSFLMYYLTDIVIHFFLPHHHHDPLLACCTNTISSGFALILTNIILSRFVGSNPAEVDNRFFQDIKILSTSPLGGTLNWGPESEISGSLKNLKPEKIGLWAKFNRHIHVLVIPKFGWAQ